jgi:hypothetical protein
VHRVAYTESSTYGLLAAWLSRPVWCAPDHLRRDGVKWTLQALIPIESCLEGGVNRANLKFTNFKHNYRPGLALELNSSPKERAKTNHNQIRRMTR